MEPSTRVPIFSVPRVVPKEVDLHGAAEVLNAVEKAAMLVGAADSATTVCLNPGARESYPAAASPADFALRQNQIVTDPERITIAITKKHSLKAITNEDSCTALCSVL